MSNSSSSGGGGGGASEQQSKVLMSKQKKFKGIRRRKWGKWVSEIRVPGTPNRLWLGSYSTAEAAAAAHDVASFYLRSSPTVEGLKEGSDVMSLSPRSVQKAASDAGMAVDAAHRVVLMQQSGGNGTSNNNGSHSRDVPVDSGREENWSFGGSWMVGDNNGGKCKPSDLNISVDDYL
uniref:AP2/ERF domain-containing protein n=1 Tax=Kalanchoe fedtschenkoi TaxID=63787 RepID=A0A7N0RBW7_KALFE